MKVKELIEELKLHDPESEVYIDAPYDEDSRQLVDPKRIYTTCKLNKLKTVSRVCIEG